MGSKPKTLRQEFEELDLRRTNKLDRARECADLTIPILMPEVGQTGEMELPVPYSSMGASGVTSLAGKIVSAILPMNDKPFFEFDIAQLKNEAQAEQNDQKYYEVQERLAQIEKQIHSRFATSNFRSTLYTVAQHLLVIGDCLLYMQDNFMFQVFRLDHYVVRRYPDGRVACIIVREWVDPELMNGDDLGKVMSGTAEQPTFVDANHPGLEPHYTKIEWIPEGDDDTEGEWTVCKELRDVKYETGKTYKVSPYLPLRWAENAGEDYGRSLCEEQIGNLRSAEALAKSLIEGAAAMAEFRMGVRPSGTASVEDLVESDNGDYIPAEEGDVFAIHPQLENQVQATLLAKTETERSLGRAFLMNSVVQPTGDRVTAYQASVFTEDIERALGGPFSSLSREIELPVVIRAIEIMQQNKEIPQDFRKAVDDGLVNLRIRTGLEALSKEINSAKLQAMGQFMLALPEPAQRVVKWDGFLRDLWLNTGLDPTLSILSPKEQQQMEEKAMVQQAQMAATEQAIKSAGTIAENQGQ